MRSRRPSTTPTIITVTTETTVKVMPSRPAASDSWKFMPNPSPTTQYCSNFFEAFLLQTGNGLPRVRAKRMPAKSVTTGEQKSEPMSSPAKRIWRQLSFADCMDFVSCSGFIRC